jgi:hypothetical protein
LSAPPHVSARAHLNGLLGPVLLGSALGVETTLVAVAGLKPPPQPIGQLTKWGASFFFPERDVVIYLAGALVGIAASMGFIWAWKHRVTANAPYKGRVLRSLVLQAAVAAAGTSLFMYLFVQARTHLIRHQRAPVWFFLLSGAVALTYAVCAVAGRPGMASTSLEGNGEDAALKTGERDTPRARLSWLDLAVPLAIALLIYVPDWRQLAGKIFMEESLFHWDFYAMGPALAFSHGRALGTDAYAMYGVGWPMVFGGISAWLPVSYGRMIQIGSIYACIYLTGAYLLLRLMVHRRLLAVLGTALLALQFFVGMGHEAIWVAPSVTVMRWAFDVWCYIALLMNWRSGRRVWAVCAGLFVGLALVFSLDTGLYLAAAAAFYWACSLPLGGDKARHIADAAWSAGVAVAMFVAGGLIASRGTLLSTAFWRGLLEPLQDFLGGFAQLPLATVPNVPTLVIFVGLFLIYLVLVGYALAQLAHKQARHFEVVNGSLAVYGLLTLLQFVGRSYDYTPLRLWMPLALILTSLAGRVWAPSPTSEKKQHRSRPSLRLGAALAGLLAVVVVLVAPRWLIVDPLTSYPNLINNLIHARSGDGSCLVLEPKDICGLSADYSGIAGRFQAVSRRLAGIRAEGKTLAVLDESGSTFYLAGNTAPWSRYPRLFVMAYSRQKLEHLEARLVAEAPDFILTRMGPGTASAGYPAWPPAFGVGPGPSSPFPDTWAALEAVVRSRYLLESSLPPYQLWRLAYEPR